LYLIFVGEIMLRILISLCLSLSTQLNAEIIVSADRIEGNRETTSNQIFSFDINNESSDKGLFLWEKIQSTPSVTVSNNGGLGQTTTVFIRGAESRHSLVLFENIELNDASTTGNLSDLSQITINSSSSIEVLPGSQSVLYGSDAIGGVLSINLLDFEKIKRPYFEYNGSYGSRSTHSLGVTHYNRVNKVKYFVNLNQRGSNGISQTSVGHNKDSEKDGYTAGSATGKIEYNLNQNHKFSFLSSLVSSTTEIDKGFGAIRDDSNYKTKSRNFLYKLESISLFLNGQLETNFSFSSVSNKRVDLDEIDNLSSTVSTFKSRFNRKKVQNQSNFTIDEKNILVGGIEFESERGETESLSSGSLSGLASTKEESSSLYLLHKREADLFWSTGARVQRIKDDLEATYKIAPGLKFSNSRTWLSFSTGFKNPSLFQRNSSSFGNQNLSPEESKSYELGFSSLFPNLGTIEAVIFHLDITNLIDTTGTYPNIRYINLKSAKSTGLNINFKSSFLDMDLTKISTEDENGFELINRPEVTASITGKYRLSSYLLKLGSTYSGPKDSGSTFSRTRLGGYTLFNGSVNFEYRRTLFLWLKLNNLLNKSYTDISNFNTEKFNLHVGFNWRY
jgi:vitamin B12 transporter